MRRLLELFRIFVFVVCVPGPQLLAWPSFAVAEVGFGSARTFPAGANPTAVAVGDFNGDGKPDVVVANNSAINSNGSFSVLLNNGDGTFTQVQTSVTNTFVLGVAVADFNGDGKLDVAFFGQSSFGVMFGAGDGTFSSLVTYPINASGLANSIAVGDFNGDKSPDVAIAMLNDNAIQLFSNNGNGTFTNVGEIPTCGNPASIVVADFNRDGNQDIAVACEAASVSIMLGNGNNTFRTSTVPDFIPVPTSIAAADLNGDGKLDLVTANTSASSASVLLGNGDGTFQVSSPIALPDKPISVVIADINGDGKLDVLQLTQGVNDLVVLTGKGDGTFNAPALFNAGGSPLPPWYDRSLVVADFNGDGKPDVLAITEGSNVSLLLGMGDGTFAPSAQSVLTGAGTSWVAAGDLNGDGFVDFVVANSAANSVSIFTGNGSNQFKPGATYTVGTDPVFVTLADVNNDGHLDIVVVCKGDSVTPGSVVILLGKGDGTFTPAAASLAPGQAPIAAAVADFNNDGNLDLAIVDEGDGTTPSVVAVYLGKGDGSFTGPANFPVGVFPQSIAAGSLSTAGHIDLVVGNSRNFSVSVLQGNGSGSFSAATPLTLTIGGSETSVAIADFNGDGLGDVVCTGGSRVVVFINQGNYTFSSGQTFVTEPGVMQVAAADFNGDGHPDIIAIGQGTGVDLLLGNGDGTFKPYIGFAAGESAWSFTVADVNNDGQPDVLVATPGVNPLPPSVTILLNAMGLTGSLGASPNPSEYEQPVTFTAQFSPSVRQSFGGSVVFSDSGAALGSVPLDNSGQAQLQLGLLAGSHTISAQYSGAGFVPLTKTLTQTVTQAPGVIDVASSANPALVGAGVILTATFTGPYGGTGSGTFSFAEGANSLISGTVNASGQGILSKADWPAGSHAVTITYSGDSNLAATTTTYSQDVQNRTTLSLASSSSTSVAGGTINYTATISSQGPPTPTGTVTFYADGVSFGTATLGGSGNAALSTTATPDGNHTITASYGGDSYSAAATSNAVSVSVEDFSASPTPTSATVRAGQSATFNLAVASLGGFNNAITFACSGVPQYATCTFNPSSVTPPANGSASVQMTVTTAGTASAMASPMHRGPEIYSAFAILGFGGLLGLVFVPAQWKRKQHLCFMGGCAVLLTILIGCGGGGGSASSTPPPPITPAGTSVVTITMTSNGGGVTLTHSVQVNLTVTP